MNALVRVRQLIQLATDPAASDAEARTSALIACRTIRQHELQIVDRVFAPSEPSRGSPPSPAPDPMRRVALRSKYSGICRVCGVAYQVGDLISWARGRATVHVRCAGAL